MLKRTLTTLVFTASLALANDTFLHQFFNNKVCDQVLENDGYFKTCYDYKAKGAKYVAYTINGPLVNSNNIEERSRFYPEKTYRHNTEVNTPTIQTITTAWIEDIWQKMHRSIILKEA